jgi:hypothetical protein
MASDIIFKIRELHNDIAWEQVPTNHIIDSDVREVSSYEVWNETRFDVAWASDNPLRSGRKEGTLGPINKPVCGKVHKLSDGDDGHGNPPIDSALGRVLFTNRATGTMIALNFFGPLPKPTD